MGIQVDRKRFTFYLPGGLSIRYDFCRLIVARKDYEMVRTLFSEQRAEILRCSWNPKRMNIQEPRGRIGGKPQNARKPVPPSLTEAVSYDADIMNSGLSHAADYSKILIVRIAGFV